MQSLSHRRGRLFEAQLDARRRRRPLTSPVNTRRLDLAEQAAELGARLDPEPPRRARRRRSASAAGRRGARRSPPAAPRGRARGAPRSSPALAVGPVPRAASRSATVSSGDVGGDRLGQLQVVVEAPARERALVGHEPEVQVMEGERLEVAGERPARLQPRARPADERRALAVVADEGDEAALVLLAGRGLAGVVEDRAEAQRVAAGELVGERLGEQGARRRRRRRRRSARGRASTSSRLASTSSVCPWTSRWWLGFCSTPRSASSSGSTAAVAPSSSSSSSPRSGSGPATSSRSSASWRSPAGSPARSADSRGQAHRPRVELEPELGAEARGAQDPQRVVGEAALRDRAQQARLEVGDARRCGSIGAAAGSASGTAIALTVKSRWARSAAIDPPRRPADVDVPGAVAARAPARCRTRPRARTPARRPRARSAGRPPRGSPATARSRSTTSRPASASRTAPPTIQASSPPASASRRGARRRAAAQRALGGAALIGPPASSRGTRGEIPQVIS